MNDLVRATVPRLLVKYAVFYIADDLGFFADEGLEVRSDIDAGPGGSWLVENLIGDKADIAIGGIWMPLMYLQNDLAEIRSFATLCHANSLLLLVRAPSTERCHRSDIPGSRALLP